MYIIYLLTTHPIGNSTQNSPLSMFCTMNLHWKPTSITFTSAHMNWLNWYLTVFGLKERTEKIKRVTAMTPEIGL